MPRQPRIIFENAYYHIMNRGAARQAIFRNEKHGHLFVDLLGELACEHRVEIHAYCLMHNHYHLLVRTPQANISELMQIFQSRYTQLFNKSVKRDGAIFRGRFKAIVIDADDYFLQVSRYIHLNPIDAKIVASPRDYPWSSYAAYSHDAEIPQWLNTRETIKRMGGKKEYLKFVENPQQPSMKEFYSRTHVPTILGTRSFKKSVRAIATYPEKYASPTKPTIADIERVIITRIMGENCTHIKSQKISRAIAMLTAKRSGENLVTIGNYFNRTPSSICMTIKNIKTELTENSQLRAILDNVECDISAKLNLKI